MSAVESPVPERVTALIGEWKRRLIDLTRRNRLLFFRPLRSASVRIEAPRFIEVFERLVIEEKAWRFYLPRSESVQESQLALIDGASGEAIEAPDAEEAELPARPRALDELLLAGRDERPLINALKNLFRRSRTDYEERGVRILYLAFGMLRWRETPQSDEIASPLLLIPCELKRDSPRDPFQLVLADEDIVANPSLEARLRSDFRVELPAPPDDWDSAEELSRYLRGVTAIVESRGWHVDDECWLSLFSFHKLVIYRDLDAHGAAISSHSLIAALGGTPGDVGFGADLTVAKELDSKVAPQDSFLVLDADSSQLAAIEGVKGGGHLVVQGPPGTGKSQTITNLIAETLAQGKTVLFVSEKMAALEVVYKRLLAASLGQYCLELHSHNAKKREVVAELYRTYRSALVPRHVMSDEDLERLQARRQQLNNYVLALHNVRAPLGRSAFDVLGELSAFESSPVLDEPGIRADTLTVGALRTSNDLTKRLASVWSMVREDRAFPWFGNASPSFGPETKARHAAILRNLDESTRELQLQSRALSATLGSESPVTMPAARRLLEVADLLASSPGIERTWLSQGRLNEVRHEAGKLQALQARWREDEAALSGNYELARLRAAAAPRTELDEAWKRLREALPGNERIDRAARVRLSAWLDDFTERAPVWLAEGARLGEMLGIHTPVSVQELEPNPPT